MATIPELYKETRYQTLYQHWDGEKTRIKYGLSGHLEIVEDLASVAEYVRDYIHRNNSLMFRNKKEQTITASDFHNGGLEVAIREGLSNTELAEFAHLIMQKK